MSLSLCAQTIELEKKISNYFSKNIFIHAKIYYFCAQIIETII